jgi:hypothetical protein
MMARSLPSPTSSNSDYGNQRSEMKRLIYVGIVAAMCSFPTESSAQSWGFAPHFGTLGVGVDVAVSLDSHVGVRGGINIYPFDINVDASDINYSASISSPMLTAVLDLYAVGGFRISGGLLLSSDDIILTGTPIESVEIGNEIYDPSDIGTVTGTITRNTLSPYLGIGFGNPAASKIGFFLDLGVGYHGSPTIAIEIDGPIASDPIFQNELDREVQELQDDIEGYRFYPVVSLGFSIGF